jgi:streptogramin lyase
LPRGSETRLITVDGEGRLWFPAGAGEWSATRIDSIDAAGDLGEPVCVDPTCGLGPIALTAGPDGSLWYSLRGPTSEGGGGGTIIARHIQIEGEAGFIGRLIG